MAAIATDAELVVVSRLIIEEKIPQNFQVHLSSSQSENQISTARWSFHSRHRLNHSF